MNNQVKIEQLIKTIVDGASAAQLQSECEGLDLNEVGIHGRTPLMVAAAEGLLPTVETLVRNGASVRSYGRYQMTALHEAAANDHVAVARYLLSCGADIDAETADGVTPLMCAASWGGIQTTKLLLENGADRKKADHRGATAADIALEKGQGGIADLIHSYPEIPPNRAP